MEAVPKAVYGDSWLSHSFRKAAALQPRALRLARNPKQVMS